jgi:hypothetical protein
LYAQWYTTSNLIRILRGVTPISMNHQPWKPIAITIAPRLAASLWPVGPVFVRESIDPTALDPAPDPLRVAAPMEVEIGSMEMGLVPAFTRI